MAAKKSTAAPQKEPVDLAAALLRAFATNERVNQWMLDAIDESIWRLPPPGTTTKQARTIAGIVAHIHNVRHMWLAVSSKAKKAPPKLDRDQLTRDQAKLGLAASSVAMIELLRSSLEGGGHVKDFKPDVVGFLTYAVAHEAHHRGQICMLAKQLGKPLPQAIGFGMWEWKKRSDEALVPAPIVAPTTTQAAAPVANEPSAIAPATPTKATPAKAAAAKPARAAEDVAPQAPVAPSAPKAKKPASDAAAVAAPAPKPKAAKAKG